MPGLPLVVQGTVNLCCGCSRARAVDQMCRQQSRVCLTAEEALAAEESLSVYCKPVELYNILQRRSIRNPLFLQRCLHYRIQEKRKRRIEVSISLHGNINADVNQQSVFPLYVILGRPLMDNAFFETPAYHLNRACILTSFHESENRAHSEANFVLPEVRKLPSDTSLGNLTIILLGHVESELFVETGLPQHHEELASFLSNHSGKCFWGKLQIESLCSSLEKCASLNLGYRTETLSSINMQHCITEPFMIDQGNSLVFRSHTSDDVSSYRLQVSVSAQEIRGNERSPYDSHNYDDVPAESLSQIIRLRSGNVLFNYRYYNNSLYKTEVTEDFTCPFCLVQCASFKGLRYHLTSSHDLFHFEFWVTEEHQAVNVSVKNDMWKSEVMSDGMDPKLQTFFYCSKSQRRRRSSSIIQNVNNVHPHDLDLDLLEAGEACHENSVAKDTDKGEKTSRGSFNDNQMNSGRNRSESYCSQNNHIGEYFEPAVSSPDIIGGCAASAQASTSNECPDVIPGSSLAPPALLQFAKTRKLSAERNDPRSRASLQKRQFFHSHRAQPMAMEQVLSDRDSEDEVDDDIADFEDRRMLDDFVDVTKDEKQIMHLWNSFVRKQRVLADGHIPWACEAFSRLHGPDLVLAPALLRCWRFILIKFWNHSLLDGRTMNNCNIILDGFQKL